MRWLACLCAAASLAWAQNGALLSNQEALKLEQRTIQLMESTGLVVPGLARASAPSLEDARQAFTNLQAAPQNAGNTNKFLDTARAYLSIADTLPKPYPFPEEGRRQFGELRDAVDRLDSHFRALLDLKEEQLHNPDRDDLKRYAEANEKVGPPAPQRPRVVFLGDSITDGWRLKEYYGNERDFVNRGISGQITGEMLGRMKADVLDLKPKQVIVLAGTNDLARGVSVNALENNLGMIADLAESHHIQPIFSSLLPVSDYHKDSNPQYAQSLRRPPARILEVNAWLKSFCQQRHFTYVDYYSALVDKDGFLQADASDDGLHPNAKGYRVMAPLALAAIDSGASPEARPVKGKRPRPVAAQAIEEVAPDPKAAEEQAAEQKAREQRAAEQKAAAQKAAEQKAADQKARAEKAAEDKAAAQKAKEQKAAGQKAAAQKAREQKAAAQKEAAQKAADQKAVAANQKAAEPAVVEKPADQKSTDQKTADQTAADQKSKKDTKKKSGLRAWLEKDHK